MPKKSATDGSSKKKKSKDKDNKDTGKAAEAISTAALAPATAAPVPNDFSFGQLFQRYDSNNTGFLSREAFQRLCRDLKLGDISTDSVIPSPRTQFDSGLAFERYSNGNALGVTRERFADCCREFQVPGTTAFQADEERSFALGRIFQRYDKNQSGLLEREEFANFYYDLRNRRISDLQSAGKPPAPISQPFSTATVPALNQAPPQAASPYNSTQLAAIPVYTSRMEALQRKSQQLQSKKSELQAQVEGLRHLMRKAHSNYHGIEARIQEAAEHLIRDLRSEYEEKLQVLQHRVDILLTDVCAIDKFSSDVAKAGSMQQNTSWLVDIFPALTAESDRLEHKPPPDPTPAEFCEFNHEYSLDRQHSNGEVEELKKVLTQKDEVIQMLLRERHKATEDMRALSEATAAEISEWVRLTEQLSAELQQHRARSGFGSLQFSNMPM